ncbi:hypothetical protein [Deinococcus pimensis]|uniref:hypothetical protein n=1 Tax=Deinococcus pimensis TaxID=309888 RepID=UPI0004864214|nr:hypothetical protein [Deinococcus pimensis]
MTLERSAKPARRPFSLYPRGKMYGVFDDLDGVRAMTSRLVELGLDDEKVEVLEGEDGVTVLDPDGRHHGLIARLVRYMQSITDERELVERYVRALLEGRYVVAVSLPNRRDVFESACRAFRDAGGRQIHYYGMFVTEQLSA